MAKKRLTPEQIGAGPSEHSQQCAVFAWAAMHRAEHPALRWMYSVPNGGDRDRVTAGRMKAEGVRKGISDICLPTARGQYHGLYLELKVKGRENETENGVLTGGCSQEQMQFTAFANEEGYAAIVAYGWEHAVRVIAGYLGLGPFRMVSEAPPAAHVATDEYGGTRCSQCGWPSDGDILCGSCEMDEDTQSLMDRDRE